MEFDLEAERAKVIVPNESIGFEIPDRLKFFTSLQNGRLILVMGGMNSFMENPFELEDGEQLADQVFADSYVFNMKVQKFITHARMEVARAKHFSCIYVDPRDPTNRFAVAAGGIIVKRHIDLFLKKKQQEYLDTDIVEQFDFSTSQWTTFNARLSIARHSAAICELKGFLYVIGGHKVELP